MYWQYLGTGGGAGGVNCSTCVYSGIVAGVLVESVDVCTVASMRTAAASRGIHSCHGNSIQCQHYSPVVQHSTALAIW